MSKVTIKDIAKYAKVSATTVSNVINGHHKKVSADTIAKINQAIDDLNYVPDFSARSLVSRRSKMIGVIIPQTEEHKQFVLENPFYSELVSGIESTLRENGYYMMLTGVDKDTTYLDVLANWNLDAIILLGIYKEGLYEQLKKVKVPVLLIDSYINDDYFYNIRIDDELGGYMATKYLIEQGHQDIALITGEIRESGVSSKRYKGYLRALNEAGLAEGHIIENSVSYDCGYEATDKIIDSKASAVFCTADLIAAGLVAGLHGGGYSVPNDVSVIGFDNLSISKMLYPALTTVNQNIVGKGQLAAQSIIDILKNGEHTVEKTQTMPMDIVVRGSVKKKVTD